MPTEIETIALKHEPGFGWFLRERNAPNGKRWIINYVSDGALRNAYERQTPFTAMIPLFRKWQTSSQVFHYTSVENFHNIIRGKELWASHHSIMNDYEEIKTFKNILIIRYKDKVNTCNNVAVDVEDGISIIEGMSSDLNYYILSFSYHGSVLSQWRAYAHPSGVSIGFPLGILKRIEDKYVNARVGACLYDPNDHIRLADMLVQCILDFQLSSRRSKEQFESLRKCFCESAPFVKNKMFNEESELRVVLWGDDLNVCERPDGRGAYAPVDLSGLFEASLNEDLLFGTIFVGPSRNVDDDIAHVVGLLQGNGDNFEIVSGSGIPLR